MGALMKIFVEVLSSEWILTRLHRNNGGTVIAVRALITTIILFGASLTLITYLEPRDDLHPLSYSIRVIIVDKWPWFGVIFASVYAALYARFSSQWSYLANLYNTIKQAECVYHSADAMAEWKAGFMEDAENLHLACKESIAPIIYAWGRDDLVRSKYLDHTPGGVDRYDKLWQRVWQAVRVSHKKHLKK